jgi:hypothetical protein
MKDPSFLATFAMGPPQPPFQSPPHAPPLQKGYYRDAITIADDDDDVVASYPPLGPLVEEGQLLRAMSADIPIRMTFPAAPPPSRTPAVPAEPSNAVAQQPRAVEAPEETVPVPKPRRRTTQIGVFTKELRSRNVVASAEEAVPRETLGDGSPPMQPDQTAGAGNAPAAAGSAMDKEPEAAPEEAPPKDPPDATPDGEGQFFPKQGSA